MSRSLSLYKDWGNWCRMANSGTLKVAVICPCLYVHLRQNEDVNIKLVSCLFKMLSNLLCIYLFYTSLDEWTYGCILDIVLLCCSMAILVIYIFLEGFFATNGSHFPASYPPHSHNCKLLPHSALRFFGRRTSMLWVLSLRIGTDLCCLIKGFTQQAMAVLSVEPRLLPVSCFS